MSVSVGVGTVRKVNTWLALGTSQAMASPHVHQMIGTMRDNLGHSPVLCFAVTTLHLILNLGILMQESSPHALSIPSSPQVSLVTHRVANNFSLPSCESIDGVHLLRMFTAYMSVF